jgi:hypothetical protein
MDYVDNKKLLSENRIPVFFHSNYAFYALIFVTLAIGIAKPVKG